MVHYFLTGQAAKNILSAIAVATKDINNAGVEGINNAGAFLGIHPLDYATRVGSFAKAGQVINVINQEVADKSAAERGVTAPVISSPNAQVSFEQKLTAQVDKMTQGYELKIDNKFAGAKTTDPNSQDRSV